MMLELLLTRHGEQQMRDSIYRSLRFLVFDELHTYRGRQGADVGMLIRRIRGCCRSKLTLIGTSATMASSGSFEKQRETVASVTSKIFGEDISPRQIIGETLSRSLPNSSTLQSREILSAAVNQSIDNQNGEKELGEHPVALWLENEVALQAEPSGRLKRGTPLSLSEIAKKLSAASGESLDSCKQHLCDLLLWISEINRRLVDAGQRYTLLPFRLHQFLAQTGAVYATLGKLGARFITLEPGVHHKEDGQEQHIFPHVFSRASGKTFICVFYDTKSSRLLPRDFNNQTTADESLIPGYVIPGGDEIWNEDEDWENLPPSWIQNEQTGKLKKEYVERMPLRMGYDSQGNVEVGRESKSPLIGWFMRSAPKGLLFDPTAGLFFDGQTNESTKLTTLGNEGRSTSTTINSFLVLREMSRGGFHLRDQKILSFTDNRQDAALQAGHFNDFIRVVRIRAAIARALINAPGQILNYRQVGEAIFKELNLDFASYSTSSDPNPFPTVRAQYEETFCKYLTYQAIYDLRRGWRVVLPNLEKCALLTVDYDRLPENCAFEPGWSSVPYLSGMKPAVREEFLRNVLDCFRLEYAIQSSTLLEPSILTEAQKEFSDKLRKPWNFADGDFRPAVLRTCKLHRRENHSASLGISSALGKYVKHFLSSQDLDGAISRDDYNQFLEALLATLLKADYLAARKARSATN
jgi:hypothetical protein